MTLLPSPVPRLGESLNENGIIILLRVGPWRILLPGDAGAKREARLLATGALDTFLPQGTRTTLLLLGHHGSRTSTTRRWLDRLDPLLASCSAGKGNRYGHPHQETLDALAARGIRLDCTDTHGALRYRISAHTIDLQTDSHPLWEEVARHR